MGIDLGNNMPLFGGGPTNRRGQLSKAEIDRERERLNAIRDARTAKAFEEERAENARRAERAKQREAERREQAEAEVAAVRATVERDLRLGGCPEADVRGLADAAMKAYHLARAAETAERGARQERELKEYFARRSRGARHSAA